MDLYQRSGQQDVRELGAVLGDVLAAQTSDAAFDTVETIRTESIAYRDGQAASRESLAGAVDDLSADRARVVARAFGTYFDLINLADPGSGTGTDFTMELRLQNVGNEFQGEGIDIDITFHLNQTNGQ